MEEYVFSAETEPTPSDAVTEPTYIWSLIALMIAIVFYLFLLQII
jgi:hypothetical protein